jgi:hypothetical protein
MSLLLLAFLAVSAAQHSSERLAPGSGREVVANVCTACHSADLIVASHMSRKTWDSAITWMQETQGMGPLEPEVRRTILDYLEETQGISDELAGAVSSPWAHPIYRPNPLW